MAECPLVLSGFINCVIWNKRLSKMSDKVSYTSAGIEDLPDEVLEFVLSLVPPYKDLHNCMSVCKRWRRCARNVAKTKQRNFVKAIEEFHISWQSITPADTTPSITKRYSHSAVVHQNSMYVFGGCTCSMTTFNDLWKLDLSTRQWTRPLTMGTYPSPKACCSMICYNHRLVLFGGWTHPASYPLYQTWHLFNELHVFDIFANKWSCINTINSPPPSAGHSVSLHGHWMICFGGLQRPSNVVHSTKSNDIWKLNMDTWIWYKQEVVDDLVKPLERYGQSQTELDDENLLVMGGTSGTAIYYSDVWVLRMRGALWKWLPVEVRNKAAAPPTLWCNPTCRIGNKLIVLSRSRQNTSPPVVYYAKASWLPRRPNPAKSTKSVDKDENINGRRGSFGNHRVENSAGTSNSKSETASKPSPELASTSRGSGALHSKTDHRREKRLEALKRIEDKLKHQNDERSSPKLPIKKQKTNLLGMYVLDISHALDESPYVTWISLKNDGLFTQGPEETVLYTLVAGKSELIMFGGIQKEGGLLACTTNLSNQVTNSLHFITPPKYVI